MLRTRLWAARAVAPSLVGESEGVCEAKSPRRPGSTHPKLHGGAPHPTTAPPPPPRLLSRGPVGFMFLLGPVCLVMNSCIHLTNICQPQTLSHPGWGLRTWPLPAWLSHLLALLLTAGWPLCLSRLRSPEATAPTCQARSGPQFPISSEQGGSQFQALMGWESHSSLLNKKFRGQA